MSDDRTPWASPGGAAPGGPVPPSQPRYGEIAPPGWTPPPQQPWPQQGWTPPPKPGLIPLRPLNVGDITGAAFQVIRRNPRPTFGFALVISLVVGVVAAGIVALVTWSALSRIDMAASEDVDAIRAGSVLLIALSAFVAALVQLAVSAIPQGVVSLEVARGALGERLTLPQLWRRVRGRIGALIAWALLLGGALVVLVLVVALPLVQLAVGGGVQGTLAAVGIGLLVGLGVLALSIWIGTKLEFVPPLILIERLPIGAAMRRSWRLTRGSFWRIFGITLLVNLIVQVAAQIVTTPITFIGGMLSVVVNPNQTEDALSTTSIVLGIVALLVGIVLNAVIIVAQSAVPTLLYLDIRMRREGLDVAMQRYTEEHAAGRQAEDPFG